MNLLLLSGSFHSRSRSLSLLGAIKEYFPENDYCLPKLNLLPFYCDDLAKDMPGEITELIDEVSRASGIVVCSPEYNHSIPAVLKNAIDWISRPAFHSVLRGKPVTIITQSNSRAGGARAQAHIKLIFDSALSVIHPAQEMMISWVDNTPNSGTKLSDSTLEEKLKGHISNFMYFVEKQRA